MGSPVFFSNFLLSIPCKRTPNKYKNKHHGYYYSLLMNLAKLTYLLLLLFFFSECAPRTSLNISIAAVRTG